MADKNTQQLQFELSPEVAAGVYSNFAVITHSSSEIITDYIQMMPGVPKPPVRSRIIMAPEHAKRLLYALQENIQKYEAQYGPIKLQQPPQTTSDPRTIAPFGPKKGEA